MNLWICLPQFCIHICQWMNESSYEWMLRITFNSTQINDDIYFAHFNWFVRRIVFHSFSVRIHSTFDWWCVRFFLEHFDILGKSHDFESTWYHLVMTVLQFNIVIFPDALLIRIIWCGYNALDQKAFGICIGPNAKLFWIDQIVKIHNWFLFECQREYVCACMDLCVHNIKC